MQDKQHNLPLHRRLAGIILAALLFATCVAAQAADNKLESIDYHSLDDGGVMVNLTLSGPAPQPEVFTVSHPARISLDLDAIQLATDKQYKQVNIGAVRSVAAAAAQGRTRVVISLNRLVSHETSRDGHVLHIKLGNGPNAAKAAAAGQSAQPTTANSAIPAITDIDFHRNGEGAGRVVVDTSHFGSAVDVSRDGNRVIAKFPGARLPKKLQQRLNVVDFATPVKYVDAHATSSGTRIVVTPVHAAQFKQVSYQTDQHFVLELQPAKKSAGAEGESGQLKFSGTPISLSLQNLSVRALLQMIAHDAGVNMVIADDVSGTMALELQDVPYDQALDIILKANGLGMRKQGNVIMVAPLGAIAKRAQAERKAKNASTDAAPLVTKVIPINYSDADKLAKLFDSRDNNNSDSGSSSSTDSHKIQILSRRGSVTAVERTNMLVVTDTQQRVDEIVKLVKQLDARVRQVQIEARIVVANRDFSRNLGVQAGVNDTGSFAGAKGENFVTNSGFSVNLPVAGAAGTITTSIVEDTFNLNLAISAMESEDKGEIISSPRVITADGQEAKIEQGVQIPYTTGATATTPGNTSFKDAKLSLGVTPRITPDGSVIMDLEVTQDTLGDLVPTGNGGNEPSINTRSLTTNVLVSDGDTVVLGGIYEQQNHNNVSRVPILGKIPLLGALFRGTTKKHNKRELLIFITPKILKRGLNLH